MILTLLDILVKLNSSFYSEGELISNRHQILKEYIKLDSFCDALIFFSLYIAQLDSLWSIFSLIVVKKMK